MLKDQAGQAVNVSHRANGKSPALRQYAEIVRDVYQTIHTATVYKFTFSWIDALWKDMNAVLYDLERLPYASLIEMMEVIEGLRAARNELRLARFLFDVREINPVHCFVMRSRAVLRGKVILEKMLQVWPAHASS